MALKINNKNLAVFHYFAGIGLVGYYYTRIGMLDFKGSFSTENRKSL
jgi:hypothetical protein